MELHLSPATERKLTELVRETGWTADELVQDAVHGFVDELSEVRDMLNSRYDELKSGRVQPISGDEIEAYFQEKSAAARRSKPRS